jgi:regulatory protein
VVVLSDGRTLRAGAEEVARAGLAPGETVSGGRLEQLKARDWYWRGRETAVRLLAARPRSAAELRARLRRDRIPDDHAQAILDDLSAAGYVDDLAFARGWVASRLRRSPCGPARLRAELRERGVARTVIEQAIRDAYAEEGTSVGEAQLAAAAAERRRRVYASLPADVQARRIAQFLERRGFTPPAIVRALDALRRAAEPADG